MARLLDMGLGKIAQISVQSNPECDTALNALTWDLERASIKYLGRKASRQAVVNGLVLWIASLEADERRRILRAAVRMLEDLIQGRTAESDSDSAERIQRLSAAYLASLAGGDEAARPDSVGPAADIAIPTRRPTGRIRETSREDSAVVEKHRAPPRKK